MKTLVSVAGVSFVLSLIFMKVWMALLSRWSFKQIVRSDGPQAHLKKSGTLTMGGVAFYLAFMVTMIIVALATGVSGPKMRLVVLVSSACFFIGLVDDLAKFFGKKTEGLKARFKLIIEILIGVLIGYFMIWQGNEPTMIWTPRWFGALNLGVLYIPFVVVVFVGTINAANLTDGLDGLLAGCYLAVSLCFLYLIYRFGDRTLLPVLAASMGSVAAFLWFNSHPAKIFMGDTGSLFLGGVLASVATLARLEIFLVVAGGVLVAEALSVMIQVLAFRLTKKRVFKMAPIHHHFELSGWSENQVVIRFWLLSAICGAAGLWLFVR
ncbi:MAG: phospho-N-acetylmuramoyl-pentapeptide-transferase [bacterium]